MMVLFLFSHHRHSYSSLPSVPYLVQTKQMYVEENTQFQLKVVSKSGLDLDGTYLPPAIHPSIADEPKTDMKTAMLEAEMVMGAAVSEVLEKTGAFGFRGCRRCCHEHRGWWFLARTRLQCCASVKQ